MSRRTAGKKNLRKKDEEEVRIFFLILQTLSETDSGSNDSDLSQDEYILGSESEQSSADESSFCNKIAKKKSENSILAKFLRTIISF